jgi:hypothetical protein
MTNDEHDEWIADQLAYLIDAIVAKPGKPVPAANDLWGAIFEIAHGLNADDLGKACAVVSGIARELERNLPAPPTDQPRASLNGLD